MRHEACGVRHEALASQGAGPEIFIPQKDRVKLSKLSGKSWRRDFLSYASIDQFIEAPEKTNRPTHICMTPIDRRGLLAAGFHRTEIYRAESTWFALVNPVQDEDLKAVMTEARAPSEAWKAINDWFKPQTPGRQIDLFSDLLNASMPPEGNPIKLYACPRAYVTKCHPMSKTLE